MVTKRMSPSVSVMVLLAISAGVSVMLPGTRGLAESFSCEKSPVYRAG